jgi:hypothetical protein
MTEGARTDMVYVNNPLEELGCCLYSLVLGHGKNDSEKDIYTKLNDSAIVAPQDKFQSKSAAIVIHTFLSHEQLTSILY